MHSDATVPNQLDQLFQHACAELRRRLESGDSAPAESVLRDFSALSALDTQAMRLIAREWELRRQRGEVLELDRFCRRFPQWEVPLRRLLRGASDSSDDEQQALSTINDRPALDGSRPPEITQTLNEHEVYEEIGRGGMGVVHRAYDRVLKRFVALKVIRSGILASSEEVRRFYREAQTAAQLHHPHIVAIHGMGLLGSDHSFTMTLASNGSLATRRGEYSTPRAAVELLVKIAAAVAHAHERGIIHRDLKPGNILLDEQNEPLVSDFGLAKALLGSGDLTLHGQVLGTPAYMAPEQAAGRLNELSPASDVWSLGVMLYELLTGTRPFRGDSSEEILERVLTAEYPPPQTINTDLDPALAQIVQTCLQRDFSSRYAHAGNLVVDLRRWLSGETLTPQPSLPSPLPIRRSWYRFVTAGVGCIALIGLAVPVALFWKKPNPELSATQTKRVEHVMRHLSFPAEVKRGEGKLTGNEDGSVTLTSEYTSLLVLTDPQPFERYRFSIDIQDAGDKSNQVGIIWDYNENQQPAAAPTWWYASWGFSETRERKSWEGMERNSGWSKLNYTRIQWGQTAKTRFTHRAGYQDHPFDAQKGVFRHLVLEVTPEAIYLFWDRQARPVMSIHQTVSNVNWNTVFTQPPELRPAPQSGVGTGKLGIFCSGGSGVFKNPTFQSMVDSH